MAWPITCAGLTVACDEHGRPGKTPSQRTRAKRIRVGCPLEMRLFSATKIRDGTEKGPERSGSFLLCVEICPSFPAAHPECPWVADRLALGVDLWASSGRYFDAYSLSLLAEAHSRCN